MRISQSEAFHLRLQSEAEIERSEQKRLRNKKYFVLTLSHLEVSDSVGSAFSEEARLQSTDFVPRNPLSELQLPDQIQ